MTSSLLKRPLQLTLHPQDVLPEAMSWRLHEGYVRSATWDLEGESITLGLWGPGDLITSEDPVLHPLELQCLGTLALKAAAGGPAQFWQLATSPEALATYRISFGLALLAALVNGVFGLVIAWALVRCAFPGRRLLDSLIDLPFALPTAVAGLALAAIYSTNGWLGAPLQALFGLKVSFTWLGVAIAMVFISLPFVVRSVEPVLEALEIDQEEAAWCLGASRQQTLLKVVLPQLMPAILAGVAQGYSRAVGEYGSVVMISSNVPFRDLITPTLIIQKLEEYDFASATVIGMVMLLFSLLSLLVINGLQVWGRNWEANPAQSF